LAPRTKAADTDETADDAADEGVDSDQVEEGEAPIAQLTKEQVDQKIDVDLKELWGEKDIGGTRDPKDIEQYFSSLSEQWRSELALRLVSDVYRIAKKADTEVVADGIELAIEAGTLTSEQFKEGLKPRIAELDDIGIDVPQAYSFAATLIVAGRLSQEDVEELAESIEVLGEPMVQPKDKLLREVAKLMEVDNA